MVDAVKTGGIVLDLQVIRPNPRVESGGRVLCEIDGEPLFRKADAATAAVDALVKPSDGLEPSTPSSPSGGRTGGDRWRREPRMTGERMSRHKALVALAGGG